jgi:cytochrome c-type biogenesis protein CcmF
MLAEVGTFLVGLALTVTLYAACATLWGIRQADPRWAESGRNGVYASTGLLGLAILVLWAAFVDDQFQIRYVAEHSNRALSIYLKVSVVWAGQEGSLLLWSFLQALFTAVVVGRPSEQTRPLIPWATVFLSLITAFFTAVTLFLSNPFIQLETIPPDGMGLNPLLRHPGMVFHPPALYLGYVGLAVPFALGLAALITRRIEDWTAAVRRWTLTAWLFLGIGLMLGARWAYDVLGWGGYWGWDPVENAGLLPWFTATALLHGAVMQEQRRGFRVWNLLLAVFSFVLVLFGTFTTRSGLIQSVHAFARSNLGSYFLVAIGVTLFGSFAMMIWRRSILSTPGSPEGLFSRDGMFYLTMILFVTLTVSVFVGSVLPTITGVFTDQWFEAGSAWFDRVTGPQFAALVLVMGVCPLLGRAVAAMRQLRTRGIPGLLGAAMLVVVAASAGFTRPVSLIGFAFIGLAGATTLTEYFRDAAARSRRAEGESFLQALGSLFGRNHRKYGGYLVHVGVLLMALGVVGTRMYPFETELVLSPGESAHVQDYTLVFEGLEQEPAEDHLKTWASLSVYRNGDYLATLRPQMEQYTNIDQTVAIPALRAGLREDLYLVLAGWGEDGTMATVKVHVNSLASFLWLGGLVFLVGGAVALWPPAQAVPVSAPRARRRTMGVAVSVTAGVLVLIAAGIAMWGTGLEEAVQPTTGRPLPGQPAPDFALDLLDGSQLTLSDLRGQVAVINLWATWCAPCEDELPDLQAVWEEYRAEGVTFIGIALQDEESAVRGMAARFGITYPLGMDEGDRIFTAYGSTGVPETFVVDAQGRVAFVHIGLVTAGELRENLTSLLDK